MLPFLVAGGLITLGKYIYDAVKDDGSSPSPSDAKALSDSLKAAREKQRTEVQRTLSAELLARTWADVSEMLQVHTDVVVGNPRAPRTAENAALISIARNWPFPIGISDSGSPPSGAKASGGADAGDLSMEGLQEMVRMEGEETAFETLKRLTVGLAFADAHLEDEKWIEEATCRRDALKRLVEEL